jgi:hypothetical protein
MVATVILRTEPSKLIALAGKGCPPAWSMEYVTPLGRSFSIEIWTTIRGGLGTGAFNSPCHVPTMFWACKAPAGNAARTEIHSINFFTGGPPETLA